MTKYYLVVDSNGAINVRLTDSFGRKIPTEAVEVSQDTYNNSLVGTHLIEGEVQNIVPELTAAQVRNIFKVKREATVNAATFDYIDPNTGDTWKFDADKDSIIYMAAVIASLPTDGTNLWVLADNTVVYPTAAQLKDIHRQMVINVSNIWVQP
jgi:hypothetical protein